MPSLRLARISSNCCAKRLIGILLLLELLYDIQVIADEGLGDLLSCPETQPADLTPCSFNSFPNSYLSCDYKTQDCCPETGCAIAYCQCLLDVFVCFVDPIPCPALCPETEPTSPNDTCDFGFGIDCFYGEPSICDLEGGFQEMLSGESVCYCSQAEFICDDLQCDAPTLTASPSPTPNMLPTMDPTIVLAADESSTPSANFSIQPTSGLPPAPTSVPSLNPTFRPSTMPLNDPTAAPGSMITTNPAIDSIIDSTVAPGTAAPITQYPDIIDLTVQPTTPILIPPIEPEILSCPKSNPSQSVSKSCLFQEEACNYGEFCCRGDNCVPEQTCTCDQNQFKCRFNTVPCPYVCPETEPSLDETCNHHPLYACEYGLCPGGTTNDILRVCWCNIFSNAYICEDVGCPNTAAPTPLAIPSPPAESPSLQSSTPIIENIDNIPMCPDLVPINEVCDLGEDVICAYDELCCHHGKCVNTTTCSCIGGSFLCAAKDVRCPTEPPVLPSSTTNAPVTFSPLWPPAVAPFLLTTAEPSIDVHAPIAPEGVSVAPSLMITSTAPITFAPAAPVTLTPTSSLSSSSSPPSAPSAASLAPNTTFLPTAREANGSPQSPAEGSKPARETMTPIVASDADPQPTSTSSVGCKTGTVSLALVVILRIAETLSLLS